jgi:hypothetical protein
MIPIPGTKRVRYLEDNMGAFALNLTPDDLKETDERIRGIRVAGGWVWKRLARPLREEGHDVYTPTMTRLGERRRLLNAAINLSTNIQDIVNFRRSS